MGFRTWLYKKTGINFKKTVITNTLKDSLLKKTFVNFCGSEILTCNVGEYTYINKNTIIQQNVEIGRYCSISSDVRIGLASHPYDWLSTHPFQYNKEWHNECDIEHKFPFQNGEKITIKNDVLVGVNVLILDGITVGNGAVIGAGSIVTKDVPDFAIVAGNPAKIIRYRFSEEIINKLISLEWWNLPIDKLKIITFNDISIAINELEKIRK